MIMSSPFPSTGDPAAASSPALLAIDLNSPPMNSGLRQRRGAAGPKAASSLSQQPPPRSSRCLQTSTEFISPMMSNRMHTTSNHQQRHPPALFSSPPNTTTASFSVVPVPAPAVATDPSSSSSSSLRFWVCVNGLDPTVQERVLARFASYGRILRQKPVGINAVALLYENPLHASKALCQAPFQVNGRYIGVFSLSEDDAAALMPSAVPPMLQSSSYHQEQPGTTGSLFAPMPAHATSSHGDIATSGEQITSSDADDVFLHYRRAPTSSLPPQGPAGCAVDRESLCLRIVRWFLSVD